MINYPVRMNDDFQIVDKYNNVVVPELTWRNDREHREMQREVGELIVELMNYKASLLEVSRLTAGENEFIERHEPAPVIEELTPKKRGRPFGWRKK